jgi:ubiquinone biosynthesis protein UbiJ
VYEVRVEEEVVRVQIDAGQIHAVPDSEPDTTIKLTRPGLRALILGARASEIEQTGDLSIQGERRRAHALLNTLSGPPLLAGLRPQLEGARRLDSAK